MEALQQQKVSKKDKYQYYYYLTEIKRTHEDFEEALQLNIKAKENISTEIESIQNFNRRGAIFYQWAHFDKNQTDSAFYYLEKSLQLSLENNNLEFSSNNLNLIATLWNNSKKNPTKSLFYFNKALSIAKQLNDLDLLVQINTNITLPLIELNQLEKAKQHLISIEPYLDALDIPIYRLTHFQKLSLIYRELKDYKNEALILQKELNFMRDFFNSEKTKNIAEIEEKYETKLKDLENQKLISEGEKKSNVIFITVLALVLAVIGLFLYISLTYKLKGSNHNLTNSIKLNKRIFSILSHDLKQPIVSLEAMLFLLDQNLLTEAQKETNRNLLKSHLKSTGLFLDDIMTWAKLEIEKSEQKIERVNIHNTIQEILALYTNEISQKHLKLLINIDQDLFVENSKMMNFIALKNLISNAIKFSYINSEITINHQIKNNKQCESRVKKLKK